MSSIYMNELCNIVRTKNAGPFFFTLDIVFRRRDVYEAVKANNLVTRDMIAQAYGVKIDEVEVFETFDNVMAIKATLRRKIRAASPGDQDVYAMNQEVPALQIRIPLAMLPPDPLSAGARA
jgi:hypothetical protein